MSDEAIYDDKGQRVGHVVRGVSASGQAEETFYDTMGNRTGRAVRRVRPSGQAEWDVYNASGDKIIGHRVQEPSWAEKNDWSFLTEEQLRRRDWAAQRMGEREKAAKQRALLIYGAAASGALGIAFIAGVAGLAGFLPIAAVVVLPSAVLSYLGSEEFWPGWLGWSVAALAVFGIGHLV